MLVLGAWVARADCLGGASNVALIAAADEVSDAWAALDPARFEAERAHAFELLPCLSEPLTSAGAAAAHRVVAFEAFVVGDEPATERAFRSLVAAYPSWRLPSDTVPRNHPLRAAFDRALATPSGPTSPLPVPLEATLLLDGRTTLDLPGDRPVVLQWLDREGNVGWTKMVASGEPPPEYAVAPNDLREAYLAKNVVTYSPPRKPVELVVTSAALAATSAGLYGGAFARRAAFDDVRTPYDELGAVRAQTNGLLLGSGVALLGSVTTAAVAAVRW